jgi:hypothetical protein
MFSNQRQNMSKYKNNEIFTPEFLENQPNFTKEVHFQDKLSSPYKTPIKQNLGQANTPPIVNIVN